MGGAALSDLRGRLALVTGSTRGIGYGIARGLAEAGAAVVLNSRAQSSAEAAAATLAEALPGASVHAVAFDVTDEQAVEAAVGRIESTLQPLDVLVNNVGIQHREELVSVSVDTWRRVIETDLTSAFIVGRSVARRMIRRGHGKIVNVGSVQVELARPSIGPYTAAKGGLRNLTRSMAAEWGPFGVQANGIAPGYIRTEMTLALHQDPEFSSWVVGRTPARRWGEVADLAGPVVWLASDGSDFVNGQMIFVDGGMSVVV